MEGRKGPFMGYVEKPPPLTERQAKELKLKELKAEAESLEKELFSPPAPAPAAAASADSFFNWTE